MVANPGDDPHREVLALLPVCGALGKNVLMDADDGRHRPRLQAPDGQEREGASRRGPGARSEAIVIDLDGFIDSRHHGGGDGRALPGAIMEQASSPGALSSLGVEVTLVQLDQPAGTVLHHEIPDHLLRGTPGPGGFSGEDQRPGGIHRQENQLAPRDRPIANLADHEFQMGARAPASGHDQHRRARPAPLPDGIGNPRPQLACELRDGLCAAGRSAYDRKHQQRTGTELHSRPLHGPFDQLIAYRRRQAQARMGCSETLGIERGFRRYARRLRLQA